MNNLRNLRKKAGYTIKQLHELTGIPVRSLEDWDAEKRQIQSYHRIKALAAVLRCGMDELMTKEEKCLYGAVRAVICLIQEEDGVYIEILDAEEEGFLACPTLFKDTITREKALELLGHIKDGKDIKQYLAE